MNIATRFTFLFIAMFSFPSLYASYYAGEITYQYIGANTITAVVTTYTRASSGASFRDSLPISWGDGTVEVIARVNGNNLTGDTLPNDMMINHYVGTHVYTAVPVSGFAVISFTDPNRNANIINIANSVNVPFYIEDTIWFAAQAGNNNGPVLLYPPVDYAFAGDTFFVNPAAYDIEADSLTFEMAVPLQAAGIIVPGYAGPSTIPTPNSPNNVISINPLTGEIIWATPQEAGLYDIAILIHEYRFGQILSTMRRDMLIAVLNDTTAPPHLMGTFTDTVIAPGTALSLPYSASGDPGYTDSMSAYSGIFFLSGSNAAFVSTPTVQSTSGTLTWTPGPNQYKQIETRIVAVSDLQECANLHSVINAFRVTVVDTNFTTGLADIAGTKDIVVYPVPANNILHVNTALPPGTAIIDMIGREYSAKISDQQIDISGLTAGIYLLRWQDEGKTIICRFIKE
jgi:hypothetical protein